MKYLATAIVAVALLFSTQASAEPPKTRQEAIAKAKKYEEKAVEFRQRLEKMTDKEWEEAKKKKEEAHTRKMERSKERKAKRATAKKIDDRAPMEAKPVAKPTTPPAAKE